VAKIALGRAIGSPSPSPRVGAYNWLIDIHRLTKYGTKYWGDLKSPALVTQIIKLGLRDMKVSYAEGRSI